LSARERDAIQCPSRFMNEIPSILNIPKIKCKRLSKKKMLKYYLNFNSYLTVLNILSSFLILFAANLDSFGTKCIFFLEQVFLQKGGQVECLQI